MHSVLWDSYDKGHGGHVDVPNKRSDLHFVRVHQYGSYDVMCIHSMALQCNLMTVLFQKKSIPTPWKIIGNS